jgi:hypothetical protein
LFDYHFKPTCFLRNKKGQNNNGDDRIIPIVVLPALPVTSLGNNLT